MQLCRVSVLVFFATSVAMAQSPAPMPTAQPQVWTMQDSGSTASFRGIDSVDGTVAWASGTEGTVLRTTDGGTHWQKCAVPDGDKDGATLDFRGVQAWDAQTAIVMASGPGDKSRLYKTTDGCRTWRLVFTNPDKDGFWDAIRVADQQNLMILGDAVGGEFSIFRSTDGGKTLDRTQDKGLGSNVKEGAFAASNSSLVVDWVDGYLAFGTGSPTGARLFNEVTCKSNEVTCKSGVMWTASSMPSFPKGEGAGIFAVELRDWQHWVSVGGDYTKPNAPTGTAAWSSDGGKTWIAANTPPHGYRSTVQWSTAEKLWITAGTNGSDLSRDDGKTWHPLDNGNWNALSLPFVVGPKGRIARLNPPALPKP